MFLQLFNFKMNTTWNSGHVLLDEDATYRVFCVQHSGEANLHFMCGIYVTERASESSV